MRTMFTPILRRAVDAVPGAVGAVFIDADGEAVDSVGSLPRDDILVLAAHLGIIWNQLASVLNLFHFGEATEVVLHHHRVDVIVHAVGHGYILVYATAAGVHLASALKHSAACAQALRAEM